MRSPDSQLLSSFQFSHACCLPDAGEPTIGIACHASAAVISGIIIGVAKGIAIGALAGGIAYGINYAISSALPQERPRPIYCRGGDDR